MPVETIRIEWPHAAHARIVLNRPERHNALRIGELRGLDLATQAIAQRGARVVSIVAEGDSFGVGGDIGEFAQALDEGRIDIWLREAGRHLNPAIARLRAMDAAVVVGAHGPVAGGSVGLMLCGDLVVAADDLRIDLAYARLGASPDAGTSWFLPRLVNPMRAFELLALGGAIDAAQALEYGLVTRIVPRGMLLDTVDTLAARLLDVPPVSLANFKRLVGASLQAPLETHLQHEIEAFVAAAAEPVFAARVRAFTGKRRGT
jgi:2-(1,2-epoxy-1,2-dihydrophenyl)acetyl-CoA isomerase